MGKGKGGGQGGGGDGALARGFEMGIFDKGGGKGLAMKGGPPPQDMD